MENWANTRVASLEGNIFLVLNISASENWPDKRDGLKGVGLL